MTSNVTPGPIRPRCRDPTRRQGPRRGQGGDGFALARYDKKGRPDATFGRGGLILPNVARGNAAAAALAVQPNGRFLAAGSNFSLTDTRSVVVRYRRNGTRDRSFSRDGRIIGPVTSYGATDVAVQPDDKIVTAGEAGFCCEYTGSFALVRFHNDGTLDPTFGGDGVVVTTFSEPDEAEPDEAEPEDAARGVGIQSGGKIVAVGIAGRGWGSISKIAIARYTADGPLDDTFGRGGKVQTRIARIGVRQPSNGFIGSWASAVGIQPSGRIVVAGGQAGERRNGAAIGRFVLARYVAA